MQQQASNYKYMQFTLNVAHLTQQQAEDLFNKIAIFLNLDEDLDEDLAIGAYIYDSNNEPVY